jgi:ubiquinol-cytochrome c reductase cytochrome b subunit
VFATLSNWLDNRTGYRKLISALLIEEIPGGARWRYVWGSCLAFVFSVQLITGVLLMTSYSAGDTTAWSSVYFIQYEMDFGWLIRGLHHFGSQTMVVLLGIHMLQVVIAGAHLPPREVNWWLGLALLGTVLALSLTGYLLPWDQKGYWATKVATNIAGNLPVIGPQLSKIIVGGPEYGNHTLTRFYALHVGILPPLTILLIIAHIMVFRRHGVTTPANAQGEGWFWPDQAFRDMVASMLIFGVMLGLVLYGHGHKIEARPVAATAESESAAPPERGMWDKIAHAGRDGKGANLDAPADPGTKSYPARPEWYFLFLFQLLKYFEGPQEIIGTVVIPNGVFLLLALLPLLAFGRKSSGGMRTVAHGFGVLVVLALLGGAGFLTYEALALDRGNKDFQDEQRKADELGERAVQLAHEGIPTHGAVNLLRHDPLTQGPELFEKNCAVCHNYMGLFEDSDKRKGSAADLADFGSEEWIFHLLTNPGHPDCFGRTKHTTMSEWIEANMPNVGLHPQDMEKLAPDDKATCEKDRADLRAIARWLALHPRSTAAERDSEGFQEGLAAFKERGCTECHTYESKGGKRGPSLTGYGDEEWLRLMIMAPYHSTRYGVRNRMPAFRDLEGPSAGVIHAEIDQARVLLSQTAKKSDAPHVEEATRLAHLSEIDRELIIRWLLKDYRVVFGGDPISGPPKR